MATSRCPRSDCTGTVFEGKELAVKNATHRYIAIQCASCGSVIGTESWINPGNALERIAKFLKVPLG